MGNCDNIKEKGGIEKDILKNENVKLSDFKKQNCLMNSKKCLISTKFSESDIFFYE